MSDSNIEESEIITDFGSVLTKAREAQNLSVEEISEFLKIPVQTINAIEANDMAALPAATFTQGYIRAYAKYLEISEDEVLNNYYRAVPQDQASKLKPRSNLPGEASSQSPLVKMVTILLIIAGVAAIIYGSFQYYQEKADVMETELESKQRSFTGNSLDSPGSQLLTIKQNARLTANDELIVEQSDPYENVAESKTAEIKTGPSAMLGKTVPNEPEVEAKVAQQTDALPVQENEAGGDAVQQDVIEFFAENGSWMEVRDASKSRLFYNMVPKGGNRVLQGQAPFRVSLGNAKTTRVLINDLEVDISKFIRPNNTAIFTVSSKGPNIIFH